MEKWNIRLANPNDIPFIYATWLKSYHYDSWTKGIAKSVYFDNYKLVIDRLLGISQVLIACTVVDPEVILGYMVHEPNTLHYCFVKEPFRNFGIAKSLFTKSELEPTATITHKTQSVAAIVRHKEFIFNPFVLYKKE